jgi:PTH2 family peptidyl-tRNA hydrolase
VTPRAVRTYSSSLGRIATKLVIVLRSDLPMSAGKAAAQAAHAAVGAVLAQLRSPPLAAWLDEGQPKVVLRVDSAGALDDVVAEARRHGLPVCPIADAGRTQLPAGTVTCCAIGPADATAIDAVTGELPLY